ncbi:hypothetical protein OIO90_000300 [Microbotryomycetes sp. JL221]|nr:hypothetical protein OIO90_000300 [Microbotryomycetes sp. JL221]
MPPISGPATTLVWTLGTFLNLVFTNLLTVEAPYNFILQIASSEGAMFALLFRTFQKAGLSAFHFYYVPLYVVSTIPVGLGAIMSRPASIVTSGGGAAVKHGHIRGSYESEVEDSQGRRKKGKVVKPSRQMRKEGVPDHPDYKIVYKYNSIKDDVLADSIAEHTRPKLLWAMKIFAVIQMVLYISIFSWVFFGTDNFTQKNCIEKFDFDGLKWKYFAMTASFVVLGLLMTVALFLSYQPGKKFHSVQVTIARAFHSRRIVDFVARHEGSFKWGLSISLYATWAIMFVTHHIYALQNFLLLGDDPFDFGQVNWIASALVIVGIIVRSVFDVKDINEAKRDALHEDAKKRHERIQEQEAWHRDKVNRDQFWANGPARFKYFVPGGQDVDLTLDRHPSTRSSSSRQQRSGLQRSNSTTAVATSSSGGGHSGGSQSPHHDHAE